MTAIQYEDGEGECGADIRDEEARMLGNHQSKKWSLEELKALNEKKEEQDFKQDNTIFTHEEHCRVVEETEKSRRKELENKLSKFIEEYKSFAVRNKKCMFCNQRVRKKMNFGAMYIWNDGFHNTCLRRKQIEIDEKLKEEQNAEYCKRCGVVLDLDTEEDGLCMGCEQALSDEEEMI